MVQEVQGKRVAGCELRCRLRGVWCAWCDRCRVHRVQDVRGAG